MLILSPSRELSRVFDSFGDDSAGNHTEIMGGAMSAREYIA